MTLDCLDDGWDEECDRIRKRKIDDKMIEEAEEREREEKMLVHDCTTGKTEFHRDEFPIGCSDETIKRRCGGVASMPILRRET